MSNKIYKGVAIGGTCSTQLANICCLMKEHAYLTISKDKTPWFPAAKAHGHMVGLTIKEVIAEKFELEVWQDGASWDTFVAKNEHSEPVVPVVVNGITMRGNKERKAINKVFLVATPSTLCSNPCKYPLASLACQQATRQKMHDFVDKNHNQSTR